MSEKKFFNREKIKGFLSKEGVKKRCSWKGLKECYDHQKFKRCCNWGWVKECCTYENMKKIFSKERFLKFLDWKRAKDFIQECKAFLTAQSLEEANYRFGLQEKLEDQIKKPIWVGFYTMAIAVFIFVIWGGLAPLDSAASAHGYLLPNSNRKTVQSFEGGVIDKILVDNGDVVKQDQPLIILNPNKAQGEYSIYLSYLKSAIAMESRLIAETNDADKIDFNNEYLNPENGEDKMFMRNQEKVFKAHVEQHLQKVEEFKSLLVQHDELIKHYESRLKVDMRHLQLLEKQVALHEKLMKEGLSTYQTLSHYQSQAHQQLSGIEDLQGRMQGTIQEKKGIEARLAQEEQDYRYRIESEYRENHAKLLEFLSRMKSAKDTLDRTVIRSPISGVIVDLRYHTVGGAISHAQPIMDVVPENEELVAEVILPAQDGAYIKVGCPARVTLEAYKQRLVPRIDGVVIYLGADKAASQNGQQQAPVYVARIRLNQDQLHRLDTEVDLRAGMPVTAFLVRGERTFLQYLISPITESFHKAFKEK